MVHAVAQDRVLRPNKEEAAVLRGKYRGLLTAAKWETFMTYIGSSKISSAENQRVAACMQDNIDANGVNMSSNLIKPGLEDDMTSVGCVPRPERRLSVFGDCPQCAMWLNFCCAKWNSISLRYHRQPPTRLFPLTSAQQITLRCEPGNQFEYELFR